MSAQAVIEGDCLTVLRTMAPASVDVIVTSSPYNIDVAYGQYDDRRPREAFLGWLAERMAEMYRVLKPAGSCFFNFGIGTKDDMTLPLAVVDVALRAGFKLQNRVVWIKSIAIDGVTRGQFKPINSPRYLTRTFEDIHHFTKNGDVALDKEAVGVPFTDQSNIARFGHKLRDPSNVIFAPYDTVVSRAGKFDHPAGFPVEIPLWCIRLHGVRPGMIVLDPFGGTGTTGVAAKMCGCDSICIELDHKHAETARARIEATPEGTATPIDSVTPIAPATPTDSAPPIDTPAPIASPVPIDPATPLVELLKQATAAGASFSLLGAQVQVHALDRLPVPLRDALKAHRDPLWAHLGGAVLDAPPLALLRQLDVALSIPTTIDEVVAALALIARDSAAAWTPGVIGYDIETAANPGTEEARPPIKLKRNGWPTAHQPAFKGDAALDPRRSRIRLMQLYAGGTHCVILDLDRLPRAEIARLIADLFAPRAVIIHNAAFELRFLNAAGIGIPWYECTMQASGLLLGAHQRGLGDAAGTYLSLDLPKSLQTSDWSAPKLSPGQFAYAALDAIVAFRLWEKQYPELVQKGRLVAYQVQRDVTRVAVKMIDRGITLDREQHQRQINEWRTTLAEATRAFHEQTGHPPPEKPDDVRGWLEKVLPPDVLADWPRTKKTGTLSTAAADIGRAVLQVPEIKDFLSIRATEKLLSGFGDTLLDKISTVTGKLHPGYNVGGTKSGRASSNNPNIQQVPKNKSPALRAAMGASPGYTLVIGDFSSMELRAYGEAADDDVLRRDFADGIDLHRQRAAAMLGIPEADVTKAQRDAAKPINFGTIYGSGAKGLAAAAWRTYGINMSVEEAATGRHDFLNRYHAGARWMRTHHQRCTETGRIEIGPFGRVIEAAWESPVPGKSHGHYRLVEDDDEFGHVDDSEFFNDWVSEGHAADRLRYTLCCNVPVQGACADATMLAMLAVNAAIRREEIDGGLVLAIHDEIVLEVRADQAERAAEILRTSMEKAFIKVFPKAPINGLVELEIRKTWGKKP